MTTTESSARFAAIPALDRLLRVAEIEALGHEFGRAEVVRALKDDLGRLRVQIGAGSVEPAVVAASLAPAAIAARVAARLASRARPALRRVFNLTGTVLHTNLGRAPLAEEAIAAMAEVARGASSLEFDLEHGRRGDRDSHVERLVTELTGAEAACVVNNNAASVTLVLNTLANRRQVPVSRGELVEIGGAFRMPDIMARAGAKLVEIGTTNRTHAGDYVDAIGPATAMVMKVHCSNYRIVGFTASVAEAELAQIAHERGLPLFVDLGSGSLVDLARWGLPREPTVAVTLAAGADLVSFSGDKLLGGPQAGLIAGRADLIRRIKRNPLKRALRPGKMTIAALAATLALYRDPDRLAQRLPVLRLITRPVGELEALGRRLGPTLEAVLAGAAKVELVSSTAEIGSGALPVEPIDSRALRLAPASGRGSELKRIAARLRGLPVPVIGYVRDGALWLDLRTLDDEATFLGQLDALSRERPARP
jgi:L-seryl-tRNA(Ser) seleniumtransferase